MGRAMLNVCDAKKTTGIYKIGYLFAFLGSGTECRCCLGTRVALAFILGLFMGLVATYNAILSAAIIITFVFAVTLFFMLWYLWYKEQQEDDYSDMIDDEYSDTIDDDHNYVEGAE